MVDIYLQDNYWCLSNKIQSIIFSKRMVYRGIYEQEYNQIYLQKKLELNLFMNWVNTEKSLIYYFKVEGR